MLAGGSFTVTPVPPVEGAGDKPDGGVKRKRAAEDESTCFCNHCGELGHKPGNSICAMKNASAEQRKRVTQAAIGQRKVATKLRKKAKKRAAKLQRDSALQTGETQGMIVPDVSTVGADKRGPAASEDSAPAPVLDTGATEDDGEGATGRELGCWMVHLWQHNWTSQLKSRSQDQIPEFYFYWGRFIQQALLRRRTVRQAQTTTRDLVEGEDEAKMSLGR